MGSPNEAATEPGPGTETTPLTITNDDDHSSRSATSGRSSSSTGHSLKPIGEDEDPPRPEVVVEDAKSTAEHYCLRWTNHGSHVLGVFAQLLRDESLVDVTLAAEGRSLRAHKMVLSACSSFFRTLFVTHADQRHPIVILKDTKFTELQSLLQFMYKGEVSVEYGQLATLLKTAESLRVKGLADVTTTPTLAPNTSDEEEESEEEIEIAPIVIERSTLAGLPALATPRRQRGNPYRRASDAVNHHRHMRLHADHIQDLSRRWPKATLAERPEASANGAENKRDPDDNDHNHRFKTASAGASPLHNTDDDAAQDLSRTPAAPHLLPGASGHHHDARRIHHWMMDEESEESEELDDDEDEAYLRHRRNIDASGATSAPLGSPQHLPMSLMKKESDWSETAAGTSRPEGSAGASTAVDSLRSPGSFSTTSSDYGRRDDADQFSDDQMPTADVVIEEGDYLESRMRHRDAKATPGGSTEASNKRHIHHHHHHHHHRSSSATATPSHPARPKRFLSFPEGAVETPDVAVKAGESRKDEMSVVVSGADGALNNAPAPSNFLSSFLPMTVPQFDFGLRFGMPLPLAQHGRPSTASRSGSNTPRPGPSSSSRHVDDEPGGSQRSASSNASGDSPSTRSVASGFPFATSISLIESHVGVGFTLGSREKPYKCEQCGQCYKYLSAFTKHKEQNHTARLPGEKPFRCEVCGMQFKYLKSFKKHRLNHAVERLHHVYPHRAMPVPIQPASLAGMMEERSVLEMLARPQIKTEVEILSSGDEDVNMEDDASASQQAPRTMIGCPHCRMKFANEESLRAHMSAGCPERHRLLMHPEASSSPRQANSFLQGALQLQRQHQVAQHQAALMANFLAARGVGGAAAAAATAAMPPPPGLERLQQPEDVHSDREGSEDGDAKRPTPRPTPPGSAGPFLHNLIRDINSAAPSGGAAPPEYDPGRPHLCPFCGKGFRAKENLKLHIRKHTGERPFECEFCGRAFGGKSDMNRHLRIHTGERPYRCDACGKTFARADYLSKHLSTHLV